MLTAQAPVSPSQRLTSVDAFRGFVMFLMMAEVLALPKVAEAFPQNTFWQTLLSWQTHAPWGGCHLHDLIQPSFTFLVGVALPFSLARRQGEGAPLWSRSLHAFWRAFVLILLGVFLRSLGERSTNWTFEDTLTQIGLGYGFLYLIALCTKRVQWLILGVILLGYWLAFALFPLPLEPAVGTDQFTGFAAHWNRNTNIAWAVDRWWMSLFPRLDPFVENEGGYTTLNFIPTLGTMILGLLAGGVLRSSRGVWEKIRWFVVAGVTGLALGWGLDASGIAPVVKRIWTPSWVLFSGGWAFILLAGFFLVMDVWQRRRWATFLTVIGMNSIAAYFMAHLAPDFLEAALRRHLGSGVFQMAGEAYSPLVLGATVLLAQWLILWWMYQKRIFIKV